MPWNGSGIFNRIYSWVADKAANLNISSSRMDTDTNDIVTNGLGNCLTRDGQGQPTALLPMAGFRHTNVGQGVAQTDYVRMDQFQNGLNSWSIAGGTADAITLTLTPAPAALTDGQVAYFRASAANATSATVLTVNGFGPFGITKNGGQAIQPGDIPGQFAECFCKYNLSHTRWELLNPANTVAPGTINPSASIQPPTGYYFANGQQVNRVTDAALFNAITITTTGNTHSNTTVDGLANDYRGMGLINGLVEGTGIPAGTTVSAITAVSITLSQAAISTNTGITIRFLPYGQGNGSTTFNVPDYRGRTIFGRDDMGAPTLAAAGRLTNPTAGAQGIVGTGLGNTGGEQGHLQVANELVAHNHVINISDPSHGHGISDPTHSHALPYNSTVNGPVAGGSVPRTGFGNADTDIASGTGVSVIGAFTGITATSNNNTTAGNAFNVVSPGGVANMIVKR